MNVPTLLRVLSRTCYQALAKIPKQNNDQMISSLRDMHCVCGNKLVSISPQISAVMSPVQPSGLLATGIPTIVSNRGMKIRGLLKLRCKDCYFVARDARLYVMCKSQRRHNQMAMKAKPRNTWQLTHATQGKQREW